MALPDILVNAKQLAQGSVSFPTVLGSQPSGRVRGRPVKVTFTTANAPTAFYHGLGRKPNGYIPVSSGKGSATVYTAGGKIYSDLPVPCDTLTIVLKCDVAGTEGTVLVY